MKNRITSITYFHRSKNYGFSIENVFAPIISEIKKKYTVSEYYLPYKKFNPGTFFKNLLFTYKHRNKNGINHVSGDTHYILLALITCKSVLTIHDLVFLQNTGNKIDYMLKWLLWLYLPLKIADKIICISETTRQEVLKHIKNNKISVIHNPINVSFKFSEKKFNMNNPVILHIGTGWNKNLTRVIEALENIPCHLRIIGKLTNEYILLLNEKHIFYSNRYSLSDGDIIQEYQNCDIVSFPSIYEGFGMPIIEGQAIGRIVVTSNIPPMTEIGENSVVFVNPLDIESIRNGFLEIINNQEKRAALLEKSKENITRFSIEKIVNLYIKIYETIR
jgi:glycosyltransferase involved in cell wall biosynthesis